jgi:putative FmdB family regulatory protein
MPLYEYECDACGQRFELIRRFSDPEVDVCAVCGKGPVRRLFSSPAIQFKGSGWYITDYARKGKSEKTSGEKSGDSKSTDSKGADSKGADSKSADSKSADTTSEKKTDGAAKSDAASTSTSSSTEKKP